MKEIKIKSINDLLSYVLENTNDELLWFRGHSDKSWSLTPTIFRCKEYTKDYELQKIKLFKQNAASLIKPPFPTKPEEWLILMRQYHFSTRVLDWTESPLIALFFALSDLAKNKNIIDSENDVDSALFMLKPYNLNIDYYKSTPNIDTDKSLPTFDENRNTLEKYLPTSLTFVKNMDPNIIAFSAPRFFQRLQSQLGVFTIHSNNDLLDESKNEKYLTKFVIPKRYKSKIKKELNVLKINALTVYPELAHIYDGIDNE